MKVTLLLADSAQAVNGKLYVLGGGWSIAGPGPIPMALALKIDVPWNQANLRHKLELTLVDADGHLISVPTPQGAQELKIAAEVEVGRPPGLPPGVNLDAVLAVNLSPLPLPPGRYVWTVSINGHGEEDWAVPFIVREQA